MKILFFDTETTGLPKSWNDPPERFPRLVQLGFILTVEGKPFMKYKSLVKPSGFIIPPQASSIHGITTAKAQLDGNDLQEVMTIFGKAWRQCDLVVSHNFEFDAQIIDGEAHRLWRKYFIRQKPSYCTMVHTTDLLKLPGKGRGYKFPKLIELHNWLFGEDFEGAHDAFNDIQATMKCFFELQKRGLFFENLITKSNM